MKRTRQVSSAFVARFVVGFSWRDPATVGVLRTEQLLALAVGLVAVAGLAERARAHRRLGAQHVSMLEPAMLEPATVEPGVLDADEAARAEAEAAIDLESNAATEPAAAIEPAPPRVVQRGARSRRGSRRDDRLR